MTMTSPQASAVAPASIKEPAVLAKVLIAPMGEVPTQRLSSCQSRLGLAFGGGDDVQAWLFLDFSSLDCSFWFCL